jgi:hypothetical protein
MMAYPFTVVDRHFGDEQTQPPILASEYDRLESTRATRAFLKMDEAEVSLDQGGRFWTGREAVHDSGVQSAPHHEARAASMSHRASHTNSLGTSKQGLVRSTLGPTDQRNKQKYNRVE